MMLDALVLGLDARTQVARLSHTTISEDELLELMVSELGLDPRGERKLERLRQIQEFLDEWTAAGRNSVLVVDEAQNLSLPVLEEIRLLSNLRSQGKCSLQIVLAGQPEFRTKLDQEDLRQLKQRIGIRYHLTPLSARETGEYIVHRLSVAGANGSTIFDKGAVEAVFAYAGGVPRMINVVCDRALVAGYGANRKRIGKALILETVEDIEGTELGSARIDRSGTMSLAGETDEAVELPSRGASGAVVSAGVMSADLRSPRSPSHAVSPGRGATERAGSHTRGERDRPGVVGASIESSRVPAWVLPVLVVVAALAVVAVSGVGTGWWRSPTAPEGDRPAASPVRQERPDEPFAVGSVGVAGDIVETTVDEASAGEIGDPGGTEGSGEAGEDAAPVAGGTETAPAVIDDPEPAPSESDPGDSAWELPLTSGPGGPYRAVALSGKQADAASAAASLLIDRGISAEVIPTNVGDMGLWYRVAVTGGYPDLESAREVVEELKRLGYDGAWVHRE
jgi:general secretion pathway protein A